MALTFLGDANAAAGTSSVTPPGPDSPNWGGDIPVEGDHAFILLAYKRVDATFTVPSGWELIDTAQVGTGTPGADAGPIAFAVLYRKVPSGGLTMPEITMGGNSNGRVVSAGCVAYRGDLGGDGEISFYSSSGSDTSADTSLSVSGSFDIVVGPDDQILTLTAVTVSEAELSGVSLTIPGVTTSSVANPYNNSTNSGDDLRVAVHRAQANSGTSTGVPSLSATLATASTGGTLFMRLREVQTRRLYLTSHDADFEPGEVGYSWQSASVTSGIANPRKLAERPGGDPDSASFTETSSNTSYDALLKQFVSPPASAAGSITGLWQMAAAWLESNSDADMNPFVVVWVTQGDSGERRGPSFAVGAVGAAANPDLEFQTSASGIVLPPVPGYVNNTIYFEQGDRIVVELGFRARNSTTSSRTGTVYFGGTGTSDMAQGVTTLTRPGWIDLQVSAGAEFTEQRDTQRLYLTSESTPVPVIYRSDFWSEDEENPPLALLAEPAGASTPVSATETSSTSGWLLLVGQWTSPPAAEDGTLVAWDWVTTLAGYESSAAADMRYVVAAWIMATDGTYRQVVAAGIFGGELDAGLENASAERLTLTAGRGADTLPQEIFAGERIVVEIGVEALNSSATAYTATVLAGGTGPDLQLGDIGDDLQRPGWIDIPVSPGLVFEEQTGSEVDGEANANLGGLTAAAAGEAAPPPEPGDTIFGFNVDSTGSSPSNTTRVIVSAAQPASNGIVQTGHARLWLSAPGSTWVKFVIYADDGGTPGELLAESAPISLAGTEEAERVFAFVDENQIEVTAGTTYWIGAGWLDPDPVADTVAVQYSRAGTAGARIEQNFDWPELPENFGTPAGTGVGPLDVWVSYARTATDIDGTATADLGGLTATADGDVSSITVVYGTAAAGEGPDPAEYPSEDNYPSEDTYPGEGLPRGLGGLVATATGTTTVEVEGAGAASLGQLTATAAGARTVLGAAAALLGDLSAAADAARTVLGAATAPLGAVTGAAAGIAFTPIEGTASASLGPLVATATGTREVTSTGSATLGGLAAAAAGLRSTTGAAAAELGGLAATAGGVQVEQGTASALLGGATATATGERTVAGLATAASAVFASASGVRVTAGTASAQLGFTAAAGSARVVPATADAELGQLTATAEGVVTNVSAGAAAANLGALTATAAGTRQVVADASAASALVASSGGIRSTTGSAAANLGGLVAAAGGAQLEQGTGVASLGDLSATANGEREVIATAAAQLDATATAAGVRTTFATAAAASALTAHAGASSSAVGSGAAQLGGLAAAATGRREIAADASAALGQVSATASGTRSTAATAAASLGDLAATATGVRTGSGSGSATADLGQLAATATGTRDTFATAAAASALVASAGGTRATSGTGVADLGDLTAIAGGEPSLEGSASAELGGLTASATGQVSTPAGAAANLGGLTASATGEREVVAVVTAPIGLAATAAGTRAASGTGSAPLGALVALAVGDGVSLIVADEAVAALGGLVAHATGTHRMQYPELHAGEPVVAWMFYAGAPTRGPGLYAGQPYDPDS